MFPNAGFENGDTNVWMSTTHYTAVTANTCVQPSENNWMAQATGTSTYGSQYVSSIGSQYWAKPASYVYLAVDYYIKTPGVDQVVNMTLTGGRYLTTGLSYQITPIPAGVPEDTGWVTVAFDFSTLPASYYDLRAYLLLENNSLTGLGFFLDNARWVDDQTHLPPGVIIVSPDH